MIRTDICIRACIVDRLHDLIKIQGSVGGKVGCLTEFVVSEEFYVADMHGIDSVHLTKVTDDLRDIVVRIGSERTCAKAKSVCR